MQQIMLYTAAVVQHSHGFNLMVKTEKNIF